MSGPAPGASKEPQIRAAMERLLTGRALHAPGRLDVVGLATEAGVARQDLYRNYRPLLEEFRTHRRRLQSALGAGDLAPSRAAQLAEQLSQATERAARYRAERDAARRERDANASQVAYLVEQNRLLRHQLAVANTLATFPPSARSDKGTATPSTAFTERMV